ncbi:unnamed protein product, partial [Oppiella nova]
MNNYLIILLLFCVIYQSSIPLCWAQTYRCDVEEKVTNKALKEIFLFAADKQKFPTNGAEMKGYCDANIQNEKVIKTYGDKCLKPNTKRIVNLLIYSIVKNGASTCKSKRRSLDFQRAGKCGNAGQPGNRKCWDEWVIASGGIAVIDDHKMKIPLSC